jgi:hypothetical protein
VRLDISDVVILAVYGALLLRSASFLALGRRRGTYRKPGARFAAWATVCFSIAAMTFALLEDGTSVAITRLRGWLLWPAGAMVGLSAVLLWKAFRLRAAGSAGTGIRQGSGDGPPARIGVEAGQDPDLP